MAAHLVTGLKDVIETASAGKTYIIDQLAAALTIGCWTEDLSLDQWRAFRALCEEGNLEAIGIAAEEALEGAEEQWEDLGRPNTREEWYATKYPSLRR